MKAMILAAGRGKRMMPLTKNIPKPLLEIQGLSIIEHNIKQLKQHGFDEIIINTAYLGQQIEQKLGNGKVYGVSISYSREPQALETAGGIINAMHLLGKQPFLVINGDTLNNYPLVNFSAQHSKFLAQNILAHLVLVPNPVHKLIGDFNIDDNAYLIQQKNNNPYTFSGIGLYHRDFFKPYPNKHQALRLLLEDGIKNKQISAEVFHGFWCDIGTPKQLNDLQYKPLT